VLVRKTGNYRGGIQVNGVGINTQESLESTSDMIRSMRSSFQGQHPHKAQAARVAARTAPKPLPFEIPSQPAAPIAAPASQKPLRISTGRRHVIALIAATIAGMSSIWFANRSYAPEMYGDKGMVAAAAAHTSGKNYAVFDLNLNIRALRDEQLKRMTKTPDVILLGASHWQEAHKDLLKGYDMFNAHIHRDYWEDPLGMVELLVRHKRLPKKLIISVRDNQFTPVGDRKDFLWEPGIPAYRVMASRLGIETESLLKTLPYDRGRALISLPMLFENATRWHNAPERPHATDKKHFKTLDVLLPDGSIVWADKHMQLFTPERTRKESLKFAALRHDMPPKVDPQGVFAFEKLLDFLKQQGVQVTLVHPPFNPIYYDALQGSPYAEGLQKINELTQRIAKDHGLQIFGSFNPHDIGCTSDMYIDAEHANDKCLQKIFDQFVALDTLRGSN
jgi:hypothetical protein